MNIYETMQDTVILHLTFLDIAVNSNIEQLNNVLDNELYVGRDTKYGMNPDKPYVAFTRHTS